MVLSVKQWYLIKECVEKNPLSRVAKLWNIRMHAKSLNQQQSVDREMLSELNLSSSPTYGFSSDIIHNPDLYEEVHDLILTDPGWDDNFGPTNPRLNKIYRQRILDPSMPEEYRRKMDVFSSIHPRLITLEEIAPQVINGVLQYEKAYNVSITKEEFAIEIEFVNVKGIQSWKLIQEMPQANKRRRLQTI